jgi:uncharacterized protein (UPF0147 family)
MDLKVLKDTAPWDWPKDTDRVLLEILGDDRADETERLLAAELAGCFTVINDELAGALLSIVLRSDETERLRSTAVISLGPVLEHCDTDGFEDDDYVPISEDTFRGIQKSLHELYRDTDVPKDVRRRVLEASVRAPQDWHTEAVRDAYFSTDEAWMVTAVFCMRFIRGFEEQILEAMKSGNPAIHFEAVCAAGNWELDAAWPHIADIVNAGDTDKPLLLAAIDAVACIRPQEAVDIIGDLADSEDEEIAEAAFEALATAEGLSEDENPYYNDEGETIH